MTLSLSFVVVVRGQGSSRARVTSSPTASVEPRGRPLATSSRSLTANDHDGLLGSEGKLPTWYIFVGLSSLIAHLRIDIGQDAHLE